jgi:hypothetical protein
VTVSIHIEAHPDRGNMREQIDEAMKAIGFQREPVGGVFPLGLGALRTPISAEGLRNMNAGDNVALTPTDEFVPASAADTKPVSEEPAAPYIDNRPIGSASGGRKRRTKEEIAGDEVLLKLAAAKGVSEEKLNGAIAQVGRAGATAALAVREDADKPAISTGEERVGPEDDPATVAQDEADEADEVGAETERELTIDDLRNAMSDYVAKHGMPATQEDGPAIFRDAIGAPASGEGWKLTLVAAAGQDALRKSVAAWKQAAQASSRYGRA